MANNSIVIVCEDEIIAKVIRLKLSSLRKVDSITLSSYQNAVFEIESNIPSTVIIYTNDKSSDISEFISKIKPTTENINCPILMISDDLNEDFILDCFDVGVNDVVSLKHSDAEILTKTISCIQKNTILKELETKNKILAELGVLQLESGFYLKEYIPKILKAELENLQKYGHNSTLMIISADINCKTQLIPATLGNIIKKCTRAGDVIGFCSDDKFYVLLPKTDSKGAMTIYERIKKELNSDYSISVGACESDNLNFEELDKNVNKAITEALELGNTIVISDTKEKSSEMNWLDNNVSGQKNFKFFKQAFLKKLENVINPTFFQTQKVWEERLLDTKIEQYSNDNESIFSLCQGEIKSSLKITYPGFARINVDFSNNFQNTLPKERISLDLPELNESKLEELLLEFIKEYKDYIKLNR